MVTAMPLTCNLSSLFCFMYMNGIVVDLIQFLTSPPSTACDYASTVLKPILRTAPQCPLVPGPLYLQPANNRCPDCLRPSTPTHWAPNTPPSGLL